MVVCARYATTAFITDINWRLIQILWCLRSLSGTDGWYKDRNPGNVCVLFHDLVLNHVFKDHQNCFQIC